MKLRGKSVWLLAASIVGMALLIALCWSFGRNVVWAITNVGQTRHQAFDLRVPATRSQDERYIRCSVLNISVELPESMLGSQRIEGRENLRNLTFSDGDRKVTFTLVPYTEQRQIFLPLPQSLQSLTDAKLMLEIYQADTLEFSYKMSPDELEQHDWALSFRNTFAYDRLMESYFFYRRAGVEVLCLGSDSGRGNNDVALRRVVVWSGSQVKDGGIVHIMDARTSSCVWGDVLANSIRIDTEANTPTDWSTATDLQILETVRVDAQDVEH